MRRSAASLDPGIAIAGADSATSTAPFVVLIIDDEEDARTILRHELEESGCVVIAASSADEGIAIARQRAPNLITLDIMMPGKNGWDALREIKADERLRDIPVVIVSVVAHERGERGLGEAGRIEKPVTREKLFHLIPQDDKLAADLGEILAGLRRTAVNAGKRTAA